MHLPAFPEDRAAGQPSPGRPAFSRGARPVARPAPRGQLQPRRPRRASRQRPGVAFTPFGGLGRLEVPPPGTASPHRRRRAPRSHWPSQAANGSAPPRARREHVEWRGACRRTARASERASSGSWGRPARSGAPPGKLLGFFCCCFFGGGWRREGRGTRPQGGRGWVG